MDFTRVPVENIYYLLSYAWNKLEEAQRIPVDQCDEDDCASLFARVLSGGVRQLIRQGLDRGYVLHKDSLNRIRGKIDFPQSLSPIFMKIPQLVCEYDEFDYNILHNQVLKTTIRRMVGCANLEESLQDELRSLYRRLDGIQEIALTKRHFGLVKLHRNNLFYAFLMQVCELIFDNLVPSEQEGRYEFRDFRRDHRQMAALFESFVYQFYALEQNVFQVTSERIRWDVSKRETEASMAVLPEMRTDITLTSPKRKIIIDTKFYFSTLQSHHSKETVHSSNLYQLFAYLMNTENLPGTANQNCEGILLYPVTSREHSYEWTIKGHRISVKTINLNQSCLQIHTDLMSILF